MFIKFSFSFSPSFFLIFGLEKFNFSNPWFLSHLQDESNIIAIKVLPWKPGEYIA